MSVEAHSGIFPATPEEKRYVEKLREIYENCADSIELYETPVLKWLNGDCYISAGNNTIPCIVHPYYVGDVTATGKVVHVDSRSIAKIARYAGEEDVVLVLNAPFDEYLLRFIVGHIVNLENIRAIVLYHQHPSSRYYKRSFYTPHPFPTIVNTSFLPKPVVSIRTGDLARLLSSRGSVAEISASAHAARGKGISLISSLHGRKDSEIHVSTSLDRWFSTDYSYLQAEATLIGVCRELRADSYYSVKLIHFTAKEIGDPNLTAYHYSWGARYYLSNLASRRDRLSNVVLNINIEALYGEPVVAIHLGEEPVVKTMEKYGVFRHTYNHAGLNSLVYAQYGVPSISITSIGEREFEMLRNSTLVAEEHRGLQMAGQLLHSQISPIIRSIREAGVEIGRHLPLNEIGEQPLEIRYQLERVSTLAVRAGYRRILKEFTTLSYVFVPELAYSHVTGGLLADALLLNRTRPPGTTWAMGRIIFGSWSQIYYDGYVKDSYGFINAVSGILVDKWSKAIEKIILEHLVCDQYKGCAGLE